MDKVRFSCPRCRTIMQTGVEKVGYDVACPHCSHRFKLVEQEKPSFSGPDSSADASTMPPMNSPAAAGKLPAKLPVSQYAPPVMGNVVATSAMPDPATYSCPYCGTTSPPIWKSEVSQIGWIVFAILLVTTCVFCFAGLFIRDKYRVCSRCRVRLS